MSIVTFSIIVPIYNVEQYLVKCLDSILAQTYTDFEALLVDDGSTDSSPAICDEYARKDKRLRVIHKKNGGLISARNAGLLEAKGDYICYVDGDDWTKPEMLEFVYNQLQKSPVPLDMVMFAADNVYEDHMEKTLNRVPEGYYNRERLEKEIFPCLLTDRRSGFQASCVIHAHTWNKVCTRELQLAHYCRDERIRMFTDVPLTYECILHCQNVYICNECLYEYNKTNESSIRAKGKANYLTKSFYYLVSYMRARMLGFSPDLDRQLNEYPVTLIIRSCMAQLLVDRSFFRATRTIRKRLNECQLLSLISLKGLPRNPYLLILLFKLHLDIPAMLLCALKNREAKN